MMPADDIDPLDLVLRATLPLMESLAVDRERHAKAVTAIVVHWLRHHSDDDAYRVWRQFECAVVTHYAEAMRLDRRDAPPLTKTGPSPPRPARSGGSRT
jgi:hypothetical protein